MLRCLRFLIPVYLWCASASLRADTVEVNSDRLGIEFSAGYGWMNSSLCRQAIGMSGTYGHGETVPSISTGFSLGFGW